MGKETGIKRDGVCFFAAGNRPANKPLKRWPCYGRQGQFCITPPPYRHQSPCRPDIESEWYTITHQPTGFRAIHVRKDDPKIINKLGKVARLFGKTRTVLGIQKKFKKLDRRTKKWLQSQVPWLLPAAR